MNRSLRSNLLLGCLTFLVVGALILGVNIGIAFGLAELVHAAFPQVTLLQAFTGTMLATWVLAAIGGVLARS